jgi:WD40 repeat protein
LWDIVNCTHLITLEGHSSHVASVTFSPDGTRIVSGSDTLGLWDIVNDDHLNTLDGHSSSNAVTSVAFSPDGTCIVSGSFDETL